MQFFKVGTRRTSPARLVTFAGIIFAALAQPSGGEESPLRDPPSIAQPAEQAPAAIDAPTDITSVGPALDEAAEPQGKGAAGLAKPVRPLANVPMPPLKPAQLVNREPAASGEEDAEGGETVALASASPVPALRGAPLSSNLFASLPQPGAAPAAPSSPLVSAPQEQLPLPPSMRDGQPPEADSDGEEEASLPGEFEKQVDTVELACIKPEVMEIVKRAGQFFRAVPIITSGYRARGRRGSLHRRCMAVDFVVPGVSTQTLASYLRSQPDSGGVGTYCNTKSVHVDTGEKRNWGYCGFHRTYFSLR